MSEYLTVELDEGYYFFKQNGKSLELNGQPYRAVILWPDNSESEHNINFYQWEAPNEAKSWLPFLIISVKGINFKVDLIEKIISEEIKVKLTQQIKFNE